MSPDQDPNLFKIRLLFGLFEADASGTVAIGAVLLLFAMFSAGRWRGLW